MHHKCVQFYYVSFLIINNKRLANPSHCRNKLTDWSSLYMFFFFLLVFFSLLLCWMGVHCVIYKGSYSVSTISHLKSPPPPVPGIVTTGIIFAFTHVYPCFALYSSSLLLLSLPPPRPTSANPLSCVCKIAYIRFAYGQNLAWEFL
jgi:hypothetical protein